MPIGSSRVRFVPALPASLADRVLQIELKLYPAALRLLAEDKVKLKNGMAVFA